MEIDERTQQAMLYKDLESLIQRYYDEFDMTYESILGVLFRRLVLTVLEDIETDDDEEFTEEDD